MTADNVDAVACLRPVLLRAPRRRAPGLGLSVSLGLVESHHGTIRLHSLVGVGTTVEIRLPIVASPPIEDALVEARSAVA